MNAREVVVDALRFAKGITAQTHQNHRSDSACAVCQGDPEAIADLVLDGLKRSGYAIIRQATREEFEEAQRRLRTPGRQAAAAQLLRRLDKGQANDQES